MLRQQFSKEVKGDTVYLNVTLANPEENTQELPATFSGTLNQPIVDNPSLYKLIISRFSIPGRAIPLFYFQTVPFPNTDIDLGVYTIGVEYNADYSGPVNLEWIPQTLQSPLVPVFSALQPNQDPLDTYYYNYSYVNLANMMTIALRQAIAAVPTLPPGTDAYVIYNNQSGFFSILGTEGMFHSNNPLDTNNVRIWFNSRLITFFTGFKNIHNAYNSNDGRDEMILIENDLNNAPGTQDGFNPNIPAGYYQMQLEFNSDANLETLTRILVTSNSFGGVQSQSELTGYVSDSYRNVVADFVPQVSVHNGDYRTKFQYYAQSEFYRRVLMSTDPLSTLNLNFLWQGARPSTYRQIILRPGDILSIQFIFEKEI